MDTDRAAVARRLLLLLDAVMLAVAMFVAFFVHRVFRDSIALLKDPPVVNQFVTVAYLALPIWLVLIVGFGLDRIVERPVGKTQLAASLLKVHAAGMVALSVVLFITQLRLNRSMVALYLISSFVLLFLDRSMILSWASYQHRTGQGRRHLLFLGADLAQMRELAHKAQLDPYPPDIVGYVLTAEARTELAGAPSSDVPLLGRVDELETILHRVPVDEAFLFPPLNDPQRAQAPLEILHMLGIPANVHVPRYEPFAAPPLVHLLYGDPFLTFEHAYRAPLAIAVKHAFDLLAAAVLIVALAPLLAVVSMAIWLRMGRPLFFVQERAGLYGRRFRMLKFRTMKLDAEADRDGLLDLNEMDGPVFKIADDPRITSLGRFLRQWSIDELPQLFNVLTGAMSLVGPRPLPIREQQEIHGWHRRRLSMKPGITGLWQVSGRNDLSFEDWMRLDLRYIDEWSLRLDLWILARTIPAVFLQRGAR